MSDDLTDLMLLYSRRGVQDWKDANDDLKRKAIAYLSTGIADNEEDTKEIVRGANATSMFIPMPKHRCVGIERCFFLPMNTEGRLNVLILFLLVNRARKNCIAFRFEPSHGPDSVHGYSHVQLTRKLVDAERNFPYVPDWLPDSYPAFPVPARNSLEMFLSMMTAVHGFRDGIDTLLVDIFQQVGRTHDARKYWMKLRDMLNTRA